jgi:hypothetical protein
MTAAADDVMVVIDSTLIKRPSQTDRTIYPQTLRPGGLTASNKTLIRLTNSVFGYRPLVQIRRNRRQPSPADIEQNVREQLHIMEAIHQALERWPEVSAAAYDSTSPNDLRNVLIELIGLDEIQANAVMEMQIRRITRLERERIASRVSELRQELAQYGG